MRSVRVLRPGDLFARVGGGVFDVMINNVTMEQAQSVAEPLLTIVSEQPFRRGGPPILVAVTTSTSPAVARPAGAISAEALM